MRWPCGEGWREGKWAPRFSTFFFTIQVVLGWVRSKKIKTSSINYFFSNQVAHSPFILFLWVFRKRHSYAPFLSLNSVSECFTFGLNESFSTARITMLNEVTRRPFSMFNNLSKWLLLWLFHTGASRYLRFHIVLICILIFQNKKICTHMNKISVYIDMIMCPDVPQYQIWDTNLRKFKHTFRNANILHKFGNIFSCDTL